MTPHDPLDIATLLRLASDDELTDAQREVLDRHLEAHPEDRDRIEFDRQMRIATGRVMAASCPDALRAKIQGMTASTTDERTPDADRSLDDAPIPFVATRRFAAAAAILVLIGAVALFRSFQGPVLHPDLPTQVAGFIVDQHARGGGTPLHMTTDDLIQQYPTLYCPRAEARLKRLDMVFEQVLGCDFPDGTEAIHLQITGYGANDLRVPISIFIEEDKGQLSMRNGQSYYFDCGEAGLADKTILLWKGEGRIYYFISDCTETTPQSYASIMKLPEPLVAEAP